MSGNREEAFSKWFHLDDDKNYRDCWNAACDWQAAQPDTYNRRLRQQMGQEWDDLQN